MKPRLAVALHAVSVRRGDKWVLRDVSWRLRPGERWALIGDNGAGKTQLLKLLCGDVWPTPTRTPMARASTARATSDGRGYSLEGQAVDLLDAKPRFAYIGGERQDKYARYGWNLRVRELVATGLHGTDLLLNEVSASEGRRVDAMLRACGLRRDARREFLSLSYGEKRLALLARALIADPDWLLLDEFYNGLDADYRQRIDAVLDAARRRGQSWVATAHRAIDVPRGTRCVLELVAGRVQASRALRRGDLDGLALRAGEIVPRRSAQRSRSKPPIARITPSARIKPRPPRPPRVPRLRASSMLLELVNVHLYVEYRTVLRDVNWQLRRGQHWGIFGANGAGKSSFLKLLYGDLAPAIGGRIERRGFKAGPSIAEWKREVGYVSPDLQSTYMIDVGILDLVASGRHSSIGLVDTPTAQDLRAARRWLKFFVLLTVAKRRPRELSYGQLRRALIARAMAANPRYLLLDEPLTGLDPGQRAIMKKLLRRLMRRTSLVIAVHHAKDVPDGMTHALRLHNRRAETSVQSATSVQAPRVRGSKTSVRGS